MQHAGVVGDLVVGEEEEAHVHPLHNRPQAGHRCANAHPHEPVFCMEKNRSWDAMGNTAACFPMPMWIYCALSNAIMET